MKETKKIKTFEQLDKFTKDWIKEELEENINGAQMTPKTLFGYAYHSEGSIETLSKILNLSTGLLRRIRD